MTRAHGTILAGLLAGLVAVAPAAAYDPQDTFRKGAMAVSVEGGYGEQFNLEGHRVESDVRFWNAGVRFSLLPLGPTLTGPLHGALEVGLEPMYQRYTNPTDAFFAGLAGVARYHFLSLGRFVPYVELAGAAGGTDLEIREIRSDFTFLVFGGLGAAVFVTDRAALYAGYRWLHVSNGNTEKPNRGFEANTGVVGVSIFFP
jgi:hypothetical protein